MSTSVTTKPVGIANLGNTCFLSSSLQALRACPQLVTAILNNRHRLRSTSKKTALFEAFQALLRDFEGSSTIVPRGFVAALQHTCHACDDDWYQPRQQADAAECIQYILDALHDAVYRQVLITVEGTARTAADKSQIKGLNAWSTFFAKEYSPVVEHFYGQHQIRIQCTACKYVSERYEPWSTLKLPIPGGDRVGAEIPTFSACVSAAHATETIEEYACDGCKSSQTARITTRISKLPNILVLTLKRFTNTGAKIRGLIPWNLEGEDFAPWMCWSRCPFQNTDAPRTVYETFAVVEHLGSSRGGHYRSFAYSNKAADWTEYDDDAVRPNIPPASVVSADSYVLFLRPRVE